jgi:protein SCO1
MLRTAALTLGLALLGGWSASSLTEGFRVWTAEGARRLAVIERPIATPRAVLEGPGITGRDLREVLADTGHITIAGFVYTRCTTVCSALGSGFQQLQRTIATNPLDGVRLLSISFDPDHDDAAQLQQYALRWGADPAHWRFATVPNGDDLQRLLRAFQVVVVPDGRGGFEHNAALLVIDERARLVRIFDVDELDTALAYARSIEPGGALP